MRFRASIGAVLAASAVLAYAWQSSQITSTHTGPGQASATASASSSSFGGQQGKSSGSTPNLPRPTHAVFFSQAESWNDQMARDFQDGRSQYMASLWKAGKLLYFGPWKNQPGEMELIVAQDDDDAYAIASMDPLVVNKLMNVEVRAWNVLISPNAVPVR